MTDGSPRTRRPGPSAEPAGRDDRAEQVLSQTLRVMAGGGRRGVESGGGGGVEGPWWDRVTTAQLLLVAVLVGLVAGGVAGFASLLL